MKGWNKNVEGEYRKTKTEVSNRIDEIDKYAETHGLSMQVFEERKNLRKQFANLLKQEELKWIQRAKEKNIKEGEANTKFFHAKANGRHRINTIVSLENQGQVIVGQKNLEKFITSFY